MADIILRKLKFVEDRSRGHDAEEAPHYIAEGSRLRAHRYPLCCTGVILSNFGGSDDAYIATCPRENIKAEISAWVVLIKQGMMGSKSFISACTTLEQVYANDALLELGFVPTAPICNEHNDYSLINWTLPLAGWE